MLQVCSEENVVCRDVLQCLGHLLCAHGQVDEVVDDVGGVSIFLRPREGVDRGPLLRVSSELVDNFAAEDTWTNSNQNRLHSSRATMRILTSCTRHYRGWHRAQLSFDDKPEGSRGQTTERLVSWLDTYMFRPVETSRPMLQFA